MLGKFDFEIFKFQISLIIREYGYSSFHSVCQLRTRNNNIFLETFDSDVADEIVFVFRRTLSLLGCILHLKVDNRNYTIRGKTNFEELLMSTTVLNFDLNALYTNPNPVYLTEMGEQTVLFANPAALEAQQKTPQEFLGEKALALNYPDELNNRDRLLLADGRLNEYAYDALRWYKDGSIWRRKKMKFISNFQVFDFLGVRCRFGEVLQAEETQHFID